MLKAALALALLAQGGPALPAQAGQQPPSDFILLAWAQQGAIRLDAFGPPGTQVALGELAGGQVLPLGTLAIGPEGLASKEGAAFWDCGRRTRRFVAYATLPDGRAESASYGIRTPSCKHRLALSAPSVVRRGQEVVATVRDLWEVGAVRGRLCARTSSPPRICSPVDIPTGALTAKTRLRPGRPGRWRLELTTAHQRVAQTLWVGRPPKGLRQIKATLPEVLMTGDSTIQTLDSETADRLDGRARVVSQSIPGTGISKPGFSWLLQARRQIASVRPAVTVMSLGAGEGFPMKTPLGVQVACCGEPWVALYGRRAARVMRAFTAKGGQVVWLTTPAPRDPDLQAVAAAVNEALRRVSPTVPGVEVLELDRIFTPGGRYRDTMPYRGRRVRVRAKDGVHLSVTGSAIAARALLGTHAVRGLR